MTKQEKKAKVALVKSRLRLARAQELALAKEISKAQDVVVRLLKKRSAIDAESNTAQDQVNELKAKMSALLVEMEQLFCEEAGG